MRADLALCPTRTPSPSTPASTPPRTPPTLAITPTPTPTSPGEEEWEQAAEPDAARWRHGPARGEQRGELEAGQRVHHGAQHHGAQHHGAGGGGLGRLPQPGSAEYKRSVERGQFKRSEWL